MTPRIDLNCDLGEGAGQDALLMPLITSANLACGGHAGNDLTMREVVRLAKLHRVAVGAHPGYEDRENFGRVEIPLKAEEVRALVSRQIAALKKVADELGVKLAHVKPHGALYNVAARDMAVAKAVVRAVCDANRDLVLFALSGSLLASVGLQEGLRVANEVFADRAYGTDGSLVPRSEPGSVHADEETMLAQVVSMIERGKVRTKDGIEVPVRADTLCLHGDGVHAVSFARRIRETLSKKSVQIAAFST